MAKTGFPVISEIFTEVVPGNLKADFRIQLPLISY